MDSKLEKIVAKIGKTSRMETSTIFEIISYMHGKGLRIYPLPVPGSNGDRNPACFICIDVRGSKPRLLEVDGKPVRYRQSIKREKKNLHEKVSQMYVDAFNHIINRKWYYLT